MPKGTKRKAGTAGIYKKGAKVFRKTNASRAAKSPGAKMGEVLGVDGPLTLNPIISTTNTNASAFVINAIQQGTASYERTGRKIYNQSLRLRATMSQVTTDSSNTLTGNQVRMVVVWDKQPSGTLPTFDTIFGKTDQTGAEACTFLDPIRYDNMQRFSVLRDKLISPVVTAAPVAANGVVTNYWQLDEFVKLNNRETTYSGTANPATIAQISSGALYVFFRAQNNGAGAAVTAVNDDGFWRLRYTC